MKMRISEMTQDDIPSVASVERLIFSMPWSESGFLSSLLLPDTLYLCARTDEGRVIGYCGFLQSFDEADITNVAVHPDYRCRGVASAMLAELMERGRGRGVQRYTLEVRVSNGQAVRLYERLGFASVGVRKNFYEQPREDALIMWTGLE